MIRRGKSRGDHFRFGSVFIKKSNQTEFFKKNKLKSGQTDRFRFSFLGEKLARFCSVFSGFGSVFFGLTRFFFRFFLFRFGSVFCL